MLRNNICAASTVAKESKIVVKRAGVHDDSCSKMYGKVRTYERTRVTVDDYCLGVIDIRASYANTVGG